MPNNHKPQKPGGRNEKPKAGGPRRRPRKQAPSPDEPKPPPAETPKVPREGPRWRVLVTGFHDWPATRREAATFDRWRCLQNPSGMLLLGPNYAGQVEPTAFPGALPTALSTLTQTADGRVIVWTFDTLPTLWGAIDAVPKSDYDVIICLGLGVYSPLPTTRIRLERGARNARTSSNPDAANVVAGAGTTPVVIDPTLGRTLPLTAGSALESRIDGVDQQSFGPAAHPYDVEVIGARDDNTFVCNETNFKLLQSLGQGPDGCPRLVYFIHIAAPAAAADYASLADALRGLIEVLIQPPP